MGLPTALAAEEDQSEALGRVISADALGIDVADVGTSVAGFPSDSGPVTDQLDATVLNGLVSLDLGNGVSLPLVSDPGDGGLLHLGELGAVSGYAEAAEPSTAIAAAGAIGGDGTIAIDPSNSGEFGSARVSLTPLFDQAGLTPVTDGVIESLDLEVGAVASRADLDGTEVQTQYVIVDGQLVVKSPLVSELSTALDQTVNGVGDGVDALVSSEGALGSVFAGLPDVNLLAGSISLEGTTITVDGLDEALAGVSSGLLDGPIANENGVTLDLSTGEVFIDLDQVVDCNVPGSDLSNLAPNTEVLSADFLQCVTSENGLIADAVDDVLQTLTTGVTEALNATQVTAVVAAEVSLLAVPPLIPGITAPAQVTVTGTLGQFLGTTSGDPTVSISLLNPDSALNDLLDSLLTPVTTAVVSALQTVGEGTIDGLTRPVADIFGVAVDPIITSLAPVLETVTTSVVSLTINEQATTNMGLTVDGSPAADVTNGNAGLLDHDGLRDAESFTVSALTLGVLPGILTDGDAVNLSLASSTVRATVLEPVIVADPGTVNDGDTTSVTGADYPALTDVVVQLQDGDGNPVGDPVTVTTDENGDFTTDLTVPADTPAGDFQVVGTATTPAAESATTPLVVNNAAPTLSADPAAVNDGGTTSVTGADYPALTDVVVQLQDGDGNPVSDPVTVTTDENGDFTTDLTVPVDTPAGDFEVVGTADNGEFATAPLAVSNDNTADNTEVNTEVNTAENTDVNTEVNTAENTDVNTAENTDVNTAENTDVNTEVNTAENTDVNTAENTDVNTEVNAADNTDVNTTDNTEVNEADNTEVNTEVNTAENTEVNEADNTTDNTEVNAADNTDVNTTDNTEVNAADNTDVNTGVNTEVNTAENNADNTADNTATAEIFVTPKRAVQGVDNVLVHGIGYTPNGTAEVYLKATDAEVLGPIAPFFSTFAAIAVPGEHIGTVNVDENGEVTFRVDSSVRDLGDYMVTVIDNEDSALSDSDSFTVVAVDNADNTADNTDANTEVNTDANTEVNTEVNEADNTDANTEVNTDANTEVNTEVNEADNTDANTADNAGDNAGDDGTADNPAISVDPATVEDGETTTVSGEGYPANTEVDVQLVDPEGNPVGDPVTVTTDDDGAFTAEITVPEGSAAGDYTVEATTEAGETASAELAVTNASDDNTGDDATTDPVVSVDPGTVEPGDSTTVTGENYPPNTEVDVQLVDPEGNPVGEPVTVTTDDDGNFTADISVPEGSAAGDYTVEANAETGETASADLTVTDAPESDNAADNTSDNAGDNTGANTGGDNTGDNSTGGNGSAGNGSTGSTNGGSSTSGSGSGFLAQTGAAGTAAMVGLAALLLIGGAAGVLVSRRSMS